MSLDIYRRLRMQQYQSLPINRYGVFQVKDLNYDIHTGITRAGVIITTENSTGSIVYGLGIDRCSREITDFGGRVERKDENFIEAAFREFREETLDLAPLPSEDTILKCQCVIGKKLCFVLNFSHV